MREAEFVPFCSTFTLGSLSLLRKECLFPFSLPPSTLDLGPGLAAPLQGICGPCSHTDGDGSGEEGFTSRLGIFYCRGSQAQGTDITYSGSLDSVEPGQPAEPTQRVLDTTEITTARPLSLYHLSAQPVTISNHFSLCRHRF